jgi:hypothetical protein
MIIQRKYFIIFFLICGFYGQEALSNNLLDTGGVNTIIKKTTPRTPLQIMQESAKTYSHTETELPRSEEVFLPEQDSAFYRIINLHLPINVIVRNNLTFSDDIWSLEKQISEGTPWQVALQNVRSIPPEFYNPSPVDMVHREIMKMSAFEVPFVRTYDPFMPRYDLDKIMSFFGLSEDLSPKISYSIDFTTQVEVVIYSISSIVVSTLYKGLQPPGNYTLTWNGRNQEGKLMPAGDYIAEVRIGNEKYIRKRIVVK